MTNTYKPEGYTLADIIKISQEYNCKDFKIEIASDRCIEEGFYHGILTDFYFYPDNKTIIFEAEDN